MLEKMYCKNNDEYKVYNKGILFNNGLALNETSSFIFLACDSKNTILDIAKKLTVEYDVSLDDAQLDVIECIKALAENKLVIEMT